MVFTDDLYRILVVDDNRLNRNMMSSLLWDFTVDKAKSGQEALSMIQSNNYDLVLLDIVMPGMTGLEVLEKLDLARTELTTKIIVTSALNDMNTIVKALELGALDFLPKPVEESILAARLRQLLERRDTDEVLKRQRVRIDADLKKVAEIQHALCPQEPLELSYEAKDGDQQISFEFAGTMRPAYEVGGDFFDYFTLPNGNHVFAIADACGKGAPAAIYATRVHDLLRLFARNQPLDIMADAQASLKYMVGEVNTVLSEVNVECWFVTAWVGILEPQKRCISWCSAGHCEALLQTGKNIRQLHTELGYPLGLDQVFSAQIGSVVLSSGDVVYVYTDGITEHRQANGEFLGIAGLKEFILSETMNNDNLQQTIACVTDSVENSNPELEPADDITLLGLKLI